MRLNYNSFDFSFIFPAFCSKLCEVNHFDPSATENYVSFLYSFV